MLEHFETGHGVELTRGVDGELLDGDATIVDRQTTGCGVLLRGRRATIPGSVIERVTMVIPVTTT